MRMNKLLSVAGATLIALACRTNDSGMTSSTEAPPAAPEATATATSAPVTEPPMAPTPTPAATTPTMTSSPSSTPSTGMPVTLTAEQVKRITTTELDDLIRQGRVTVVDVRDTNSYQAGHVKGAISIPLDQFGSRMNEIPKDKLIVTYCA